MASVYEDWSDRGGMDVELWWPDFTRESTLWGRILRNSEIREVSSREVPLPEERSVYHLREGYVALNLRKKVFFIQRDLSALRHGFLADDRTSQVWHCPPFSAFVDDRSLEPTNFDKFRTCEKALIYKEG